MSDSRWEEKVWGRVLHIFNGPNAAISYLEVKAGFRCSRHFHRERANGFVVLDGLIVVEKWIDGNRHAITLVAGQSTTVSSGIVHRFMVLEDGYIVEVYFPDKDGEVSLDDIERLDVGGPIFIGEEQ